MGSVTVGESVTTSLTVLACASHGVVVGQTMGNNHHTIRQELMTVLQGPIRAVDVLDLLAYEDRRSRDEAMHWGTKGTNAYYRAWLWLTAVVLQNPRPELDVSACWALHRVQGVGLMAQQHRLEAGR